MNKKFFSKILIIISLILIIINNVSYAINIEKENLKKSLMHIFGSDLKVKTEVSGEGLNGSSSLTYTSPSELEINDNQIILREVGEIDGQRVEISLVLDYSNDEKKANFKMETDVNEYLKYEPEDEIAMGIFGLLMMHSNCMTMGYLALAENLNIDLNLAATYFEQCATNALKENPEPPEGYNDYVSCDLFLRKLKYDDNTNTMEASIEINLEELSKINESLLDGTIECTIEFLNEYKDNSSLEEGNENKNENINNTISNENANNVVNNTTNNTTNNTNNTVNKTDNNVVNNTTNSVNNVVNKTMNKVNNVTNNQTSKPTDNTTSNKIIPAAGSETAYFIVLSMVVISLLIYIKLRKYDDVK